VSVPRRRVLRGRLARLRAAAARLVRVRIPRPRWRALGARRTAADTLETGVSARGLGPVRSTLGWLEERAGLGGAIAPALDHPVPRSTASWWYVFGSATLALFVLQVVTGICLALVYVPSAEGAYQSLLYLNFQAPFGWFLRAVHFWGSNAMVAVMTLHMIQVFLVPGSLIVMIGLHIWLVLRIGINEWPMPGRVVTRETYRQRYKEEVHKDGVSFFPYAARKDMVACGVVVLAVVLCAVLFGP